MLRSAAWCQAVQALIALSDHQRQAIIQALVDSQKAESPSTSSSRSPSPTRESKLSSLQPLVSMLISPVPVSSSHSIKPQRQVCHRITAWREVAETKHNNHCHCCAKKMQMQLQANMAADSPPDGAALWDMTKVDLFPHDTPGFLAKVTPRCLVIVWFVMALSALGLTGQLVSRILCARWWLLTSECFFK